MIKIKRVNLCCALVVCCYTSLYAQQGGVTAGGDASGTGGSASYSVGQVDYLTETNGTAIVTQGNQQPYEIVIITGTEEKGIDLIASVYPNPTADLITLSLKDAAIDNMTYRLYDMESKLITEVKVSGLQTEISMAELANGVYYIKVFSNNNELKSFKIIKNK